MKNGMATRTRLLIIILISLILTIFPLPRILMDIRPPWILLVLLYAQFYLSEYFNLILVLLLGIILDTLLATVIGEHAFAFAIATWLASTKARRFYFFSTAQQMLLIAFIVFIYQTTLYLIDAFLGFHTTPLNILSTTLVSVLLWPWLRLIGENSLSKGMR